LLDVPAVVDEHMVNLDDLPTAPTARPVVPLGEKLPRIRVREGGTAFSTFERKRVDVENNILRGAEREKVRIESIRNLKRRVFPPRTDIFPDLLKDPSFVDPLLIFRFDAHFGDLADAAPTVIVESSVGEVVE
jgi:hypothetical protein